MTYNELKIKVLEKYFSRTNPMQRQAIFTINGAVLIIAGAGSGKTTVLCNRIANMVLFLCSDKAGFITGENICIDGGQTRLMIYHNDCGWRYEP